MRALLWALIICISGVWANPGNIKYKAKVFAEPNSGSIVKKIIARGEQVEVIGLSGSYYVIELSNRLDTGFVLNQNIEISYLSEEVQKKQIAPEPWIKRNSYLITLAYILFGIIIGQMWIRPILMRWYRSNAWFIAGSGPVDILFKSIGVRLSYEAFVFFAGSVVGILFGWIYIAYLIIKIKMKESANLSGAITEKVNKSKIGQK